jgi:hypothetical protein
MLNPDVLYGFISQLLYMKTVRYPFSPGKATFDNQIHIGSHIQSDFSDYFALLF